MLEINSTTKIEINLIFIVSPLETTNFRMRLICKTRDRSLARMHLLTGRTGLNAEGVEVRILSTSVGII